MTVVLGGNKQGTSERPRPEQLIVEPTHAHTEHTGLFKHPIDDDNDDTLDHKLIGFQLDVDSGG